MNSAQIAAALRILANAFEAPEGDAPAQPAVEPQKRGRGRPVKGEESAPPSAVIATAQAAVAPAVASTAPAATPVATLDSDPFASPAAPAAPTATLEDVRKALTALKEASSQDKALAVLKKAGGADNLTGLAPDKYGVVVAAVGVELRVLEASKAPAVEPEDPFAMPAGAAAPASKPLTIEDVKAAVVAAQKHTSQDTVQKVVMAHGGKASIPTGGEGPSLKALPESQFAATIAALKALPATK